MKFSPSVSIAAAVCYSLMTAFLKEVHLTEAVFVLFVIFAGYSRLLLIAERLFKLNVFIVFISVTVYFFGGTLDYAFLIFIRANLITAVNIALFTGYGADDFYYGFHSLKLPDRFTVLVFFMVKYTEILGKEYQKMKDALKVRNFRPGTNIFTYKTYAYLAGMLLVRSMDRASKLTQSMHLRGFNGKLYPFNYKAFGRMDIVMISMLIIQSVFTFGGLV